MKKIRKLICLIYVVISASMLCSCVKTTTESQSSDSQEGTATQVSTDFSFDDFFTEENANTDWESENPTYITLNGSSCSIDGSGASASGGVISITAAGTYVFSGTLDDGQIRVNVNSSGNVRIVLNGASITCSDSAPIYVEQADETIITLAEGTENTVTDGDEYVFEDSSDEPNAAIFSKDDLVINGSGSLTVNANCHNGINSKDDLIIMEGTITVTAAYNGIKGKDYLVVKDAVINITSGNDGIKSSNDTDSSKGIIGIAGGTFTINSDCDGLQAVTCLYITGGEFDITTGGGSANSSQSTTTENNMGPGGGGPGQWGQWSEDNNEDSTQDEDGDTTQSAKGLKSETDIIITGGTFNIDSSDDSVHCNDEISISAREFNIQSGDDGIHADTAIYISGGTIDISKSYEGIEAANITISHGNIKVVASDDGINVAGGNDSSSIDGRQGQNSFTDTSSNSLVVDGGYIVVDAEGDGIDLNGSGYINGGTVIVNGAASGDNGALDYDGVLEVNGGVLVASGGAGMAQTVSDSSTQCSITIYTTLSANTLLNVQDSSGNSVLTYASDQQSQMIVISSPELVQGETYTIYTGGSSTGTNQDGVYTEGIYSGGTELEQVTLDDIVTQVGSTSTGGGIGGGIGGGNQPGQMP